MSWLCVRPEPRRRGAPTPAATSRSADPATLAAALAGRLVDALRLQGIAARVGWDGSAAEAPRTGRPWATVTLRVRPSAARTASASVAPAAADAASGALADALGSALGPLAPAPRSTGAAATPSSNAAAPAGAGPGAAVTLALPQPDAAAQPGEHARCATIGNRVVLALTRALARSSPRADASPPSPLRAHYEHCEHFDVWHQVPLVPQLTGMSCWAACAAMIVGWRDRLDVEPTEIAAGAGRWQAYREGLEPDDTGRFAATWGLVPDPRRSFTVADLRGLLEAHGPLWVGQADPDLHVICIVGMYGDGSEHGTFVRVNDPWPLGRGERYRLSVRELVARYRKAGAKGAIGAQILFAPSGRGSSRVRHQRLTRAVYTYGS